MRKPRHARQPTRCCKTISIPRRAHASRATPTPCSRQSSTPMA
jgi:hypothetical protein